MERQELLSQGEDNSPGTSDCRVYRMIDGVKTLVKVISHDDEVEFEERYYNSLHWMNRDNAKKLQKKKAKKEKRNGQIQ